MEREAEDMKKIIRLIIRPFKRIWFLLFCPNPIICNALWTAEELKEISESLRKPMAINTIRKPEWDKVFNFGPIRKDLSEQVGILSKALMEQEEDEITSRLAHINPEAFERLHKVIHACIENQGTKAE